MKGGKKPNRTQSDILKRNNMNHTDWLVCKSLPDRLECKHKHTEVKKTAFTRVGVV